MSCQGQLEPQMTAHAICLDDCPNRAREEGEEKRGKEEKWGEVITGREARLRHKLPIIQITFLNPRGVHIHEIHYKVCYMDILATVPTTAAAEK